MITLPLHLALGCVLAANEHDEAIGRLRRLTGQEHDDAEATYAKARNAGHTHDAIMDAASAGGLAGVQSLFSTRDHSRVREMARSLGCTTIWSAADWYHCMDYAVSEVVRVRRDRCEPVDGLRDRLFDRLAALTQDEIDAVANFATASGLGLRAAADMFGLMLGSEAHADDPTQICKRFELMSERDDARRHDDQVASAKGPHGYRLGARLGRRLGRCR